MQYGYTTVPHLSRVVITGPYGPTGLGDTPSRRRVFVCHPLVASRGGGLRPSDRRHARAPSVPARAGHADLDPLLGFYQ